MKTIITQFQSDKFIMPMRLVKLIKMFAQPISSRYWYVSGSWYNGKTIYYKETKQFPQFSEVKDIAQSRDQADEKIIEYENMCKWSMYDKMKEELEEARLQIKDLQSNMVEKVNTDKEKRVYSAQI